MKIVPLCSVLIVGLLSLVVGNDGFMEETKEAKIVKQANEEIRRQLEKTGAIEQEVDRAIIRVTLLAEMEENMELVVKEIETGGYLMEVLIVTLKACLQFFQIGLIMLPHEAESAISFLHRISIVIEIIKTYLYSGEILEHIMEYLKQWFGEEILQLLPQQLFEENKIIQIFIEEIPIIQNLITEIIKGIEERFTQKERLQNACTNGREIIKKTKGQILETLRDILRERREKTVTAAKEQRKDLGSNLQKKIEKAEGKVQPLARGIKKIETWKRLKQAIPKNTPQILHKIILDNQMIQTLLDNKHFQELLDEEKIQNLLGEKEIKDLREKEDIKSMLDIQVKRILTTIEINMQRKSNIAINNLEKLLEGGLGKWGWILLISLLCVLVLGATIFWLYKKQRIKKTV